MKRLFVLVAVGMLILAASCDTKNIGTDPMPQRGPIVTVTVPADMSGGADAVWTITWIGGTAPYSIAINMGGGATENVVTQAGVTSPFTYTFTMVNASLDDPADYTYTVTVTDALGLGRDWTGPYTVGPMENRPPEIDETATAFAAGALTVVATDPDGDALTATVSDVTGLTVDAATKNMAQAVTAIFNYTAADMFAGGSGTTTITVDDGLGGTDTYDVALTIDAISIPADTLIATPTVGGVATATPVTIVVATGVPANAFQFLNGVGVTIEDDADYVSNTFNAGVVGGDAGDVDGYWTDMNPSGGFLLPPDNFIQATDLGGGIERWDFNLTPIGGSDQTAAEGALFNYQFEFSAAGTKTLGFQEVTGVVKRTYYSDTTTEYYWGDIANDGTVAPNSITVT